MTRRKYKYVLLSFLYALRKVERYLPWIPIVGGNNFWRYASKSIIFWLIYTNKRHYHIIRWTHKNKWAESATKSPKNTTRSLLTSYRSTVRRYCSYGLCGHFFWFAHMLFPIINVNIYRELIEQMLLIVFMMINKKYLKRNHIYFQY